MKKSDPAAIIAAFVDLLRSNDATAMDQLLKDHPELPELRTEDELSPAILAAYFRQTGLAQRLHEANSNPDLFERIVFGDLEEVVEHIQQQPDLLDSFSPDGFTPLGLSCYFEHVSIAEWLLEQGADPNLPARNAMKVAPIHSATAANSMALVALLIAHGANVNARQHHNVTALHSAAHRGNKALVELLLKNGADPELASDDGKKAADYAKEGGFDVGL